MHFHLDQYVKAHFIVGGGELFTEYLCPEDYEDEEDSTNTRIARITSLGDSKSVSYFGFANPLDVSYGAIMLKLCYATAPQHSPVPSSSSIAEKKKITVAVENQQNEESTPLESLKSKILWMMFLLLMFFISIDLFLRKKGAKDVYSGESELQADSCEQSCRQL